jgi:Bardet-Biedl syndrome 1 protein
VTALAYLPMTRDRCVEGVAVALEGGEVRVLLGGSGACVSLLRAPDTVVGMAFGRYGREANTLVLALRSGALAFKMLRRTASLEAPAALRGGSVPEVDVPLPIPKKTRLALEQGERERELAGDMHRAFQRGMVKLRLSAAREYLRVLVSQGGAAAAAALEGAAAAGGGGGAGAPAPAPALPSLRLTCEVLGLGPAFTLRVAVRNSGACEAQDLCLVLTCGEEGQYYVATALRLLPPALLPGMVVVEDVNVECLDVAGPPGEILAHVMPVGEGAGARGALSALAVPGRTLVTAVVAMPASSA